MAVIDEVKDYLASVGVATDRYSDTDLQNVIDVEAALQLHKTGDRSANEDATTVLAEALCRRVQSTLSRRSLPLGVIQQSGDADGTAFLPTIDPEIRRLEAPWRKLRQG